MAATGLLIEFSRWRGLVAEPRRPVRVLTRHSTKVVPRAKLLDETGVALVLTGLTVRYSLRHVATGTLVVNRVTAVLENQSTNPGECYYQLLTTHIAHSGDYIECWELDHGGTLIEEFPANGVAQLVRIVDDVDAT
jgi:hypothetical protein